MDEVVQPSDEETFLSLSDGNELQTALGAVVTSAAELEYAMHGLAWMLDEADHEEGLRATGAMQFEALCRHISASAHRRLAGDDVDDVESLVREVRVLMRRRNEILHSHWIKDHGRTWTMLRIRKFHVEKVSISAIQECSAAMDVAQLRVFDVARRLTGGWFPAFVLETGRILAYEGKTLPDLLGEILNFVTSRSGGNWTERDPSSA